jgi:hypothetical protein
VPVAPRTPLPLGAAPRAVGNGAGTILVGRILGPVEICRNSAGRMSKAAERHAVEVYVDAFVSDQTDRADLADPERREPFDDRLA